MACAVEFVERRWCLYGRCVILGPTVLKTQAGSLFGSVPGEHVSTHAQTDPRGLCEGPARPELLASLNVLFVTFRVIWLSGRKADLGCPCL